MVPGMFFTVDNQMVDWTVITQDLYDEQLGWVNRLGRSDAALRGADIAAVAWIGYQTPGIMEIASLDLAREGAASISSSVHGLQATRTGDEPQVSLMTHSYGSTATLMALQEGAMDVDSLVIIGSPGAAAQSVDDIGMPASRVFVGEAAWDPVVNSAFFGSDPGAASFGATAMQVSGTTDPVTGRKLTGASGHLGYFDAGTEAMRNMALVGLDRGDLVTGSGHPPDQTELVAYGR
jgi:pimeloyl-ACP methyl ester carboxylesterase